MRCLLALFAALAGLVLLAPAADAADEIFVLKGGTVLRGHVVRDTDEGIVIRLKGVGNGAQITVQRDEVVERHVVNSGRRPPRLSGEPTVGEPGPATPSVPTLASRGPSTTPYGHATPPPIVEPEPVEEGFFHRFLHLMRAANPERPQSRLLVGILLIGLVSLLVHAGGRLVEVGTISTPISILLGALFAVPALWAVMDPHSVLGTREALWAVPAHVAGWILTARVLVGSMTPRITLLYAFVLFSSLCVTFVTAALFVSV